MDKITIAVACATWLMFAGAANAQSISGQVTGSVGASVGGAMSTVGSAANPTRANPYSVLNDSANAGGDVSGGLGLKVGDRIIKFRGAVGVGEDSRDFRAGAAVPF